MVEEPVMTQIETAQQSINIIVGGVYYSLSVADVARFPDSYFAHLLQSHWTKDSAAVVQINRNGELFRYIYSYVFCGLFEAPDRPIVNLETLLSVREEADFYNLPKLIQSCDIRILAALKDWCQKQLPYYDAHSLYVCVQDAQTESEDTLLNAVHLIRPPCIATAVAPKLEKATGIYVSPQDMSSASDMAGSAYENCFEISGGSLTWDNLQDMCSAFSVCPFTGLLLNPTDTNNYVKMTHYILPCMCTQGGYCTQRAQDCYGDNKIGTIVCILNSARTGGRVTAQANGKTYSIERPGECMALRVGCAYSVEEVTSGIVVLVEFDMYPRDRQETAVSPLEWTLNAPVTCTPSLSLYSAIRASVATELERYEGVVLCLTNFYPIVTSCEPTRRFETADNALSEWESQLQLYLAELYDVDLVTVAITVSEYYTTVIGACVLDYLPHSCSEESTESKSPANDANLEQTQSAKYKIVAPVYGYGEKFNYNGSSKWREHRCMLLTGLMVTKKLV